MYVQNCCFAYLRACLEEGYSCARVTLASGLKIALIYKQISRVGLLSPVSTLPALLTCFVMFVILCNVQGLK